VPGGRCQSSRPCKRAPPPWRTPCGPAERARVAEAEPPLAAAHPGPRADSGAAKKEGTDGGDDSSARPGAKLPLARSWHGLGVVLAARASGHWRNFGWHVHRWSVASAWQRMLVGENGMTDAWHASRRPNEATGRAEQRWIDLVCRGGELSEFGVIFLTISC